jgi:cytochrome-b5 reductase
MKKKSHFDLKKFLDENPDPLGIEKTGLKEYTVEEVAKHNALPSIWTIYKGFVYDITMYIDYHPGGTKILESIYGKDMTALYNKFHSYVRIDNFLGKFKIGYIKKEKSKFLSSE